jgi:hypothetical protein
VGIVTLADSTGKLRPGQRVGLWLAGTAFASVLPVACIALATLFDGRQELSWTEICSHGDFLIIGAVLVIGSSVEMIRALVDKSVSDEWTVLAGFLAVGGIFLLVAQLVLYPLVLANSLNAEAQRLQTAVSEAGGSAPDPHLATPNVVVEAAATVVSPILLLLAVIFGAAVVRLSLGRPA